MKTDILVRTVIIALLGSAAVSAQTPTASPTQTPTPIVMGGCNHSSWNPELYTFYGAIGTTIEKLVKVPADLSDRRVFLQVTQGDGSADIKLFERQKNDTFTVTEWKKQHTPHLLADIERAIVANKGVDCVGEKVKAVLAKELGKGETSPIAAPNSPQEAFSDSVKNAEGDFIQTTIILLC